MMRVFVDCDDTLILYPLTGASFNPYGVLHEKWTYNRPLIEELRKLTQEEEIDLFIWSGGGQEYAARCADLCFGDEGLDGVTWTALSKDRSTFHLVRAGDLVIDDMAESIRGVHQDATVYTATEWVQRRQCLGTASPAPSF